MIDFKINSNTTSIYFCKKTYFFHLNMRDPIITLLTKTRSNGVGEKLAYKQNKLGYRKFKINPLTENLTIQKQNNFII